MVMEKDTAPCSFSTPVSNVFLKTRIHPLTVISYPLVPVPLCTIILHQLPKISVSSCTSLPLYFSQANSPSIISEKDALGKKNKQENNLPELSRIARDQSSPWLPKKAIAKPQTDHAKYSVA